MYLEILIDYIYVSYKCVFLNLGVWKGISDYYFVYIIKKKLGIENKEYVYIKYRDKKYVDEYIFFFDLVLMNGKIWFEILKM